MHHPNTSFNPQRFNTAAFIREGTLAIRVLKDGRVRMYGCKTEQQAVDVYNDLAQKLSITLKLKKSHFVVCNLEFKNYNATGCLDYKCSLDGIYN